MKPRRKATICLRNVSRPTTIPGCSVVPSASAVRIVVYVQAVTQLLPFAMGASAALGGNVMTDAFGLVAMVAMMPLITVQIMGVIYVVKSRRAGHKPAERTAADEEILELWEVA